MNTEPVSVPREVTAAEVLALADLLELAGWELLGGDDPFGDRCRRCGLGSVQRLRDALVRYRRSRERLRKETQP